MTYKLVIVESPAKAKTIHKYLGRGYSVLASYGHIRDLVPKEGAVDPDNHFAMKYQLIDKNARHVEAIAKAMREADALYLATDPDREGEAISWHLKEILCEKKGLQDKPIYRVVFHEITKKAVEAALANPRDISMDLVNAQQARRSLDFLVGFKLSPLLWRKIRRGLSAGRVQSPALRLIVEREREIEQFVQREYWTITAEAFAHDKVFIAKLIVYQGQKLEQFTLTEAGAATEIVGHLKTLSNNQLVISEVEKKQRKRNPSPPFTTSTLQQEASRKLGFSAQKTMRVAQQLYEGVEIDEGTVGLISYMRTDSVHLSEDAVTEIRACILAQYGASNCPDEPRVFKTKAKNAQEAHEAIRPTACARLPALMKPYVSQEQFRLYELIWKRTMASQMVQAILNTVSIVLTCGTPEHVFKASGSVIEKPGFLSVYQEGVDDAVAQNADEGNILPPLAVGETVRLQDIISHQHFTEPPPRYGEASLVKVLEEFGIGRPSTYASIISTLQNREYVILESKRFHPTDVGRVVNKFLTEYFTQYVDYDFTAHLEDELDAVARGESEWIPLLERFWTPFYQQIQLVGERVKRSDVTQEALNEPCPQCGKMLATRLGKGGRFVGCTGYPECDYTRNLQEDGSTVEPPVDHPCPQCGLALGIKHGRYGKFIGCSGYPECRHIEPLEKPEDLGVLCPECKTGQILKRKSRKGKIFYSCGRYPDCHYALWDQPLNEPCPKCQGPILTLKITKRSGSKKICPNKQCGFQIAVEEGADPGEGGESV
jgi:DNA topoisomerase-1